MTRREPSFHGAHTPDDSGAHRGTHSGTHDGFHIGSGAPAHVSAVRASGFTRFVSTLQVAGTLIGVPLGLASGYSIYRSNFSAETACQSLRGNIVAMLDKNVDASTRRMLVRKDIDTFEQSCGGVDPDAHAAFKALLETPAASVPAARVAEPARKPEAKPDAKVETKIKPEPKSVAKVDNKVESKLESKVDSKPETVAGSVPDERDAAMSDARWLAAVRQALVTHAPERAVAPRADTQSDTQSEASGARAEALEVSQSPRVVLQPSWVVPAPASAPQPLAPPAVQAGQTNNAERPVPPAPIPMTDSNAPRSGSWFAQIPFVGQVIDRATH